MSRESFQLKIKIAWSKEFLGLSIDQLSSNYQYSLTPYYFWPKTQAWEQLKLELDSKFWLKTDEKIRALKVVGDIMNYWFLYRSTKTFKDLLEDFPEVDILIFNA